MRSPFRSKYKITQPFGVNADYYKKFGLAGHEGIDLIPTGTVWEVASLTDGVVVNETDDPRSGAYGIWLTVWSPNLHKAFQYCHLRENYVSAGDKVSAGTKLGIMGNTGNSTGPHLHLNVFEVDGNGVRLNRNNGYNGGIDPLPVLESLPSEPSLEPEQNTISILKSQFEELVRKATITDKVGEVLKKETNESVIVGEIERLVKLEDQIVEKDRKISELQAAHDELHNQLVSVTAKHVALADLHDETQAKLLEATQSADSLKKAMESQKNDIDNLTTKLAALEKLMKDDSAIGLIVRGFAKLVGR